MRRIRLSLPEKLPFTQSLQVRVTDLNYGGHLAHQQVLVYCQEARAGFLGSLGYSEVDLAGVGLILADAAVQYRAEAFAGDKLDIALGISVMHRKGFDFVYRLTRAHDQVEIARVKTGMVCFDYNLRSPQAMPEAVKAQFRRYVINLPYD